VGLPKKKLPVFFAYLPGFLNPGSLSQKLYKTDTVFAYLPGFLNPGSLSQKLYKTDTW